MKSPTIPWIVAAFALGCAAATTAQQAIVPTARAADTPTWQYLCTKYESAATVRLMNEKNQEAFNAYGAEGWELIGAFDHAAVCYKRQG